MKMELAFLNELPTFLNLEIFFVNLATLISQRHFVGVLEMAYLIFPTLCYG